MKKITLLLQNHSTSPLYQLKPFLRYMLFFWVIGSIMLILWGYENSFLVLNRLHTPFLDSLMPHLTHLGDGAVVSGIFALFLYRKNPALILNLILGMFSLIFIIGIAKQLMFPDWHRPPVVFDGRSVIHYITLYGEKRHSFPSGHSATVAVVMTMAAYYFSRKTAVIWALLILIGSYTRLYIGVHFLGDIVAGSMIGVILSCLLIYFVYPGIKRWTESLSEKKLKFLQYFLLANGVIAVVSSIFRLYPSLLP